MRKITVKPCYIAFIDDEDYECLSQYNWSAARRGSSIYAQRNIKKPNGKWEPVLMHIEMMNPQNGMCTDHIDRNGLNNQRYNLRLATKSQNGFNSSKFKGNYKGVNKHRKGYRARLMVNRVEVFSGYFKNEIDAAKAYDAAALKYCGEFAYTNFNYKLKK